MILLDVNVLVFAFRGDSLRHADYRGWLLAASAGDTACGASDAVLSGFIRVVTHPRILAPPAPVEDALRFIDKLRARPSYVHVVPGRRHWGIFDRLCREVGAKGNLVPDAYLAATALEVGAELATADRGFARFRGLRWRHPLASAGD